MTCGVGRRQGLDPTLLWLWCRPAAIAPIRPLAWEPPYAAGAAQEKAERPKKKKKRKKERKKNLKLINICIILHEQNRSLEYFNSDNPLTLIIPYNL